MKILQGDVSNLQSQEEKLKVTRMPASHLWKYLTRFFVLMSLSCGGLLCAQEQQADKQEKEPKGIVFTAISLSNLPYESIYYRNGEDFIKIEWRNGRRSKAYASPEAKPSRSIHRS